MWRFLLLAVLSVGSDGYEEDTGHPQHRTLSASELNQAAGLTNYPKFVSNILKPILRVRTPGTKGHRKVEKFIERQFKNLGWTITLDKFDANTPLGKKPMTNIIATLNPNAKEHLVISAHYDSKLIAPKDGKNFVAATDSAVPCAMMIELARTLTPYFTRKQQQQQVVPNVTLDMIFFDGEEAFITWSKNDSLYGSRHLAEVMENKTRLMGWNGTNKIPSIKSLILLDLIGAPNPAFYDHFPKTSDLYNRLHNVERRMTASRNLVWHTGNSKWHKNTLFYKTYFPGKLKHPSLVEDDHVPFLERGVPTLHAIALPFPGCWHNFCDKMANLDHNSINNLIKIFRVFLAEYFNLSLNTNNNNTGSSSSRSGR